MIQITVLYLAPKGHHDHVCLYRSLVRMINTPMQNDSKFPGDTKVSVAHKAYPFLVLPHSHP